MRRAKAVAPAIHPYVQWLCAHLPEAGSRRAFVLASSTEAAATLRNAVAAERRALLGVRFLTPAAFVRELSWLLGEPVGDAMLSPLAERALLRDVLAGMHNEVAAYALRHRTSLSALLSTCREWLRGGMPAPSRALSAWARETLAIAGAFANALQDHPGHSRSKCVARVRALLEAGKAPQPPLFVATVGHHDAPDVTAVLDLLATRVPDVGRDSVPACELQPAVRGRSAHPNLDTELRAAAHRCAVAFAAGTALRDMVVAAPRLGPYVPFVSAAFAAEGVPVRAHAETALAHEPRGALAVHAVRLLFDGAPARAYLALAGSDLAARPLSPSAQHALEVQARTLGLAGGTALPERVVEALREHAPAAAACLGRLAGYVRQAAALSSNAAKVDALASVLDRELVPPAVGSRDAEAAECLAEALQELHHADADDFVRDALDVLQGRGLPIGETDSDAVHVVEYADALAFPVHHLTLLGAADDQLPQPPPPPTYLGDDDRQALGLGARAATRQAEAAHLARLLALPLQHLHVSRPLTDAQGRPVGASPLLAATGAGDEVVERAHPLPRALARVHSGLASLDAAVVHIALAKGSAAAASKLLGARGAAALKRVQALERFAGDLTFDGDVGNEQPSGRDAVLSVSGLEQLARCAHQFLFQRLLKVTPLPPEPDALSLAPAAVGSSVHELLSDLHQRLLRAAADSTPVDVGAFAAEVAPRLDAMLAAAAPLAHTLPGLHRILVRQWARALARSFADDARSLRAHAITPLHQEYALAGDLDLGGGRRLAVRGRADRVDRLADGSLRIVDYKTGRNPAQVLSTSDILKGRKLQMPAYAAMAMQTLAGGLHDLGVRAVHPGLPDDGEFWLQWRYADQVLEGKFKDGMQETLRVLADVRDAGAFVPSMDAARVCRFCDFRAACRRLHPPSRERIYNSDRAEVQRYLRLRGKSSFNPLLGGDDAP